MDCISYAKCEHHPLLFYAVFRVCALLEHVSSEPALNELVESSSGSFSVDLTMLLNDLDECRLDCSGDLPRAADIYLEQLISIVLTGMTMCIHENFSPSTLYPKHPQQGLCPSKADCIRNKHEQL